MMRELYVLQMQAVKLPSLVGYLAVATTGESPLLTSEMEQALFR
jgi:hypothetical protein